MTIRTRFSMPLLILALLGFLAFSATASAAPPVARDGKIYACYKAKGKGKGTLRLVRNGKVRCQRKWKKVSWYARGVSGAPVLVAPVGPKGDPGPQGEQGTAGNVVVTALEGKVSELLTRVQSLEGVLSGVTNGDLLNAVDVVPLVANICERTEALTDQTTALGSTLGSLNTLLNTLLLGFSPVQVPTALTEFNCPSL
ncbi:MAG TPA: hypothetical protein VI039_05555 [Solirubrobacterales bacterium]